MSAAERFALELRSDLLCLRSADSRIVSDAERASWRSQVESFRLAQNIVCAQEGDAKNARSRPSTMRHVAQGDGAAWNFFGALRHPNT